MRKDARILVTGSQGLVGSALLRELADQGYTDVIPASRADCDLTERREVRDFFLRHKPTHVFHAAAQVYGILGNIHNKGRTFLNNVLINSHVIDACREAQVEKIVALGTIATYPEHFGGNPIREDVIFNGRPHSSEDSYAHAKRAMLAQLEAYYHSHGLDYAFAISTNLYGENDRFDDNRGHVVPSLVKKCADAKREGKPLSVWGDGHSTRDFLHASDAARALVLMMHCVHGAANMASGQVVPIQHVVEILQEISGVDRIVWDTSKPTGQSLRQFDMSRLSEHGFSPSVRLRDGLKRTYEWYLANRENARGFRDRSDGLA